MKFLMLALAALTVTEANANPSVVKVISQRCGDVRGTKHGSGTIVKKNGTVYILTSDHVVYHGNQSDGICHRIYAEGKEVPAQLLAANSFKGLALLKPLRNDAHLSSIAQPTESLSDAVGEGAFAQMAGYAAASRTLLMDRNAQVLSNASDRKVLPGVETVFEVKGHSEYGMSGGALFDYAGRYAGLISHQYLRLRLGAPTSLHTRDGNSQETGQELIALVIPGSALNTWLDLAITGKGDLRFDPAAQIRGDEEIVLDGMRFSLARNCKDQRGPVGGEGAGIGGRGGEGAGIGGSGHAGPACQILVTIDRGGSPQSSGITASWYLQLREKLLAGASARITGTFFHRQRSPVRPLIPFFASVAAGHIPLLAVESPFVAANFVETAAIKKAEEAKAAIAPLFSSGALSGPALELAKDCEASLDSAIQRQWELVDLKQLLDAPAWNSLMMQDFTRAVELRSKLLQLGELLLQLRV